MWSASLTFGSILRVRLSGGRRVNRSLYAHNLCYNLTSVGQYFLHSSQYAGQLMMHVLLPVLTEPTATTPEGSDQRARRKKNTRILYKWADLFCILESMCVTC